MYRYIAMSFLLALAAQAEVFEINGRPIEMPVPNGYFKVTEEMTELHRLCKAIEDPFNDTLAYYINEKHYEQAIAEEIPSYDRWFIVKVNKELRNTLLSEKDFGEMWAGIKLHNQQIFSEINKHIDGPLSDISETVSDEYDMDLAVDVSDVVPLNPHHEGINSASFSMYLKVGISVEGLSEKEIISATSTFLNTSGSVLFLYAYAPKADLEWTRATSTEWAESVLDNNVAPPIDSSFRKSFNWGLVLQKTIVGGVLGGLAGLCFSMVKRFKGKA